MSAHTPTPWRIAVRAERWSEEKNDMVEDGPVQRIEGPDGQHVCGTCDGCNNILLENAEFLIKAANSHEALVEALEGVLRVADRATAEFDAVRAALALAKEGA